MLPCFAGSARGPPAADVGCGSGCCAPPLCSLGTLGSGPNDPCPGGVWSPPIAIEPNIGSKNGSPTTLDGSSSTLPLLTPEVNGSEPNSVPPTMSPALKLLPMPPPAPCVGLPMRHLFRECVEQGARLVRAALLARSSGRLPQRAVL